jgi:hypothetical protein
MSIATRRSLPVLTGVVVGLLAAVISCSTSLAAPVTVELRVEGSTKTLFEGPISTEAILGSPGIASSKGGAFPCDFTENGEHAEGFGTVAATPTAALYDAAIANHLEFAAAWSTSLKDFLVEQVGSDKEGGPPNYEAWGYAVNYTTANVGGCQFQLAPGSEVLWAYNYFNLHHLLSLSGPTSVDAGTPFTVHVVDGQTGQPVEKASVGEVVDGVTTTIPGSSTTDVHGNATVVLAHAGTVALKATEPESVRSDALTVCVHDGNDGTCGTTKATEVACPASSSGCGPVKTISSPPPIPEVARAGGAVDGRAYSKRTAPRILAGSVDVPPGETLHEVRIALERRVHSRCYAFSGNRGAFVRGGCRKLRFFDVGDTTSFTYLLPARLPRGSYVYDVEAVNDAGGITALTKGLSSVAFSVK